MCSSLSPPHQQRRAKQILHPRYHGGARHPNERLPRQLPVRVLKAVLVPGEMGWAGVLVVSERHAEPINGGRVWPRPLAFLSRVSRGAGWWSSQTVAVQLVIAFHVVLAPETYTMTGPGPRVMAAIDACGLLVRNSPSF